MARTQTASAPVKVLLITGSFCLTMTVLIVLLFCVALSPIRTMTLKAVHQCQRVSCEEVVRVDSDVIRFMIRGDQQTIAWLTDREVRHMNDVRNVFMMLIGAALVCGIYGWLVLIRSPHRPMIVRNTSLIGCGLIVAILATALFDFTSLFGYVHRVLFSNDLWLLDPLEHALIRTYTEPFFVLMTLWWLLLSGVTFTVLLIGSKRQVYRTSR